MAMSLVEMVRRLAVVDLILVWEALRQVRIANTCCDYPEIGWQDTEIYWNGPITGWDGRERL